MRGLATVQLRRFGSFGCALVTDLSVNDFSRLESLGIAGLSLRLPVVLLLDFSAVATFPSLESLSFVESSAVLISANGFEAASDDKVWRFCSACILDASERMGGIESR